MEDESEICLIEEQEREEVIADIEERDLLEIRGALNV